MIFFRKAVARLSRTSLVTITLAMSTLLMAAPADAQALGQYYYAYITGVRLTNGGREGFSEGTPPVNYGLPTAQSYSVNAGNAAATASSNDDRGGTISIAASMAFQQSFPQVSEISAFAQLNYFFKIEGPDPDARIPVLLNATGITGGNILAQMQLIFKSDQDSDFTNFGTEAYSPSFAVNRIFYLKPGDLYQLNLQAETSIYSSYFGADDVLTSSATIDPTFTIQGGFASDYHFVGLPASAIGGAAAVPEPASWAMMIGGFGLVGGAMRRRGPARLVA